MSKKEKSLSTIRERIEDSGDARKSRIGFKKYVRQLEEHEFDDGEEWYVDRREQDDLGSWDEDSWQEYSGPFASEKDADLEVDACYKALGYDPDEVSRVEFRTRMSKG